MGQTGQVKTAFAVVVLGAGGGTERGEAEFGVGVTGEGASKGEEAWG